MGSEQREERSFLAEKGLCGGVLVATSKSGLAPRDAVWASLSPDHLD